MPPHRQGPKRIATLVDRDIRRMGQSRGFAETKLLTNWSEIAGPDVAAISRPVKVAFPQKGFGAVLTLLTTGAQAPMLEMKLPALRERVNACYGYAAISRIVLTQTAPSGFAEGQAAFGAKPKAPAAEPAPEQRAAARESTSGVSDSELRASLERLALNIISKPRA